jgi:hypothetical protein
MKAFLLLSIFCILLTGSCKKDDDQPATSGEMELSSEKHISGTAYYVDGFSFNSASFLQYTVGGTSSAPDLILSEIIDQYGAPIDTYMSSPSNYQAFKIYGTYDDEILANNAFNNYLTVTETLFTDKTASLIPHVIYTYKSSEGKYAKLLIKDVAFMQRSGLPSIYKVTVKWVFQPDRTMSFPQ